MPHIDIHVFAKLHQRTLRRTEKDFKDRLEQLGREGADELTRGIEKAAPRVRRAMNSAADATDEYGRKLRDLNKIQKQREELNEKAEKLERNIGNQYKRNSELAQEASRRENDLTRARKAADTQARAIETREKNLRRWRSEHTDTADRLRMKELELKEMRLEYGRAAKKVIEFDKALMPLRKQSAREAGHIAKKEAELREARAELEKRTQAVKNIEEDLGAVRREHTGSVKELDDHERDLLKTREGIQKIDQDLIRMNDEVTRSHRRREEAIRRLGEIEEEQDRRSRRRGRDRGGFGSGTLGNMLTDLPFVPSGPAGAVIGGGVLLGMASAMDAVVTAGQSLATLPAILTAAGAGFGTLALGVAGFGDTIKELGDPEKFAEAIQSLSPAAQQAALEIQALVQGPLKDLKNTVQDTLFEGVAERIHGAVDQFLPEITGMTSGIAGSFNNMFDNALGQLMEPGTMRSIDAIIQNIVKAFQHLEPAIAPFVDAMTKIIETGSSFLPGFSDAITNAANSFNQFITQAQADGSLQEFMQKGIDAAVALSKMLWDLGKRLFDTFGNKSPEEFQATLNSMVDTAMGVIRAIHGIAMAVNDLLNAMRPVADALGGWDNLARMAVQGFLAFKTLGVLKMLADLGGSLSSAGKGLDALPGKASLAAKGINAAFAAIVVPKAIYDILDALTQAQHMKWQLEGQNRREIDQILRERGAKPPQPGVGDFGGAPKPGQTGPTAPRGPRLPNELFDKVAKGQLPGYKLGPSGEIIGPDGKAISLPGEIAAPVQGPPVPATGSVYGGNAPAPPPEPSPTAGLPPYAPHPVPPPPADGGGPSASERKDQILAELGDPNQFMPDIGFLGQMPELGGGPMPIQWSADWNTMAQKEASGNWHANTGNGFYGGLQFTQSSWEAAGGTQFAPRADLAEPWQQAMVAEKLLKMQGPGAWPNTFTPGSSGPLPPLQYGTSGKPYEQPSLGYVNVDPRKVQEAQYQVQQEARDVRDARMELEATKRLAQEGLATQLDVLHAQEKVWDEEQQFNQARFDYYDELQGKWEKVGKGTAQTLKGVSDELSAGLDADLGLSRGLAGLADNLVRFVGNLATAPLQKMLKNIIDAHPNEGSGIIGILAAQGAFGPEWTPQGIAARQAAESGGFDYPSASTSLGSTATGMSLPAFGPGSNVPMPSILKDTGSVPSGPQSRMAAALIQQYFGSQLRGPIGGSRDSNTAKGTHDAGLSIDIPIGSDQMALGDQIEAFLQANAQALGLKYTIWRNKGKYPGGGGFTAGGHMDHIDAHFNGAGGVGGPLGMGMPAYPALGGDGAALPPLSSLTGGTGLNIPIPLPVTIVGGLGMPGGAPAIGMPSPPGGTTHGPQVNGAPVGTPASGVGLGPPPGPVTPATPGVAPASLSQTLGSAPYAPTQQPAAPQGWQPAGGGGGGGGILGAAAGAAAGMFPGGGAAAQIAMQMIQRTIQYGGEVAGALAQGAMDALSVSDPDGGPGASIGDSWLGRMAGALASAQPQLPNVAGGQNPKQQQQQGQQQQAVDPNTTQHGQGKGQPPGPLIGNMYVQADRMTGEKMAGELAYASAAAGMIPV